MSRLSLIICLTAIVLFGEEIFQQRERILPVIKLPQSEQFFNETAGSYYDLAYVFPQRLFLGFVISSDYRGGSYALAYQNKDLMPYHLSSSEFLQFLAVNELPTPSKIPAYPMQEHPIIFYLTIAILFFLFVCKPLSLFFSTLSKKLTRTHRHLKREPYTGYLRRRY